MPKTKTVKNISNKLNKHNKTQKRVCRENHPVFTKEDYDSNNGMMTSIWGPPMWHFLHCISFNYPVKPTQEQKIHYRNFIYSLRNVLPCGKCRENLANNFKKLPLTMKHMASRDTFSRYMYSLHKRSEEHTSELQSH